MFRKSMVAPLLVAPLLLLFAIFFVVPFVEIMRISFSGQGGALAGATWLMSSSLFAVIFLNTLKLALTVTLICLGLGYPAACFIAGQPASQRGIYLALVLLPFWTSVLVRTYTWALVLGREGLLNASLIWLGLSDEPQRFMFTPLAVHLGMVQILLPVAILTLVGVMTELDPGLARAARVLGASPWRAFWHVYLPMTKPGIVAAAMLLFILSLGFYITPALLGGPRHRTIANLIDLQVHQMNDWTSASAMALVLLATTIVAVVLLRWLVPDRTLHGGAG
ncbi:ABC transporter permease [Microvirga arabica]|uniref:ABC transporter permease n=1 Tax=Microvirga arabica TaxID=1128671 RepID=UPI0019393C1A|nr:ABC transporter permease [Microvirga arabica]MBM1172404.1 ABC transporter permease [Microvirga arabica]